MIEPISTVNGDILMNTPMEPIKFVVEDLIPAGLSVLAGAPKIGKSWLSLDLCLRVAYGQEFWNLKTRQSDVLYLCLEDGYARIQARLFKITDEAPETIHFATMSGKIRDGLEEQIEEFKKRHKNLGMVVIDTLQKVRDGKNSASSLYERDYEDVGILKALADKLNIAIVLVHHLRKASDEDPINKISGSNGITGSADVNFILEKRGRMEKLASLICVSRDYEDREIPLRFDNEVCKWSPTTELEIQKEEIPEYVVIVCDYLKHVTSFSGTATELLNKIKKFKQDDYPTVSVLKKKIIQHIGFIINNGIKYECTRTSSSRSFILTYDAMTDMTLNYDMPIYEKLAS